MSDDGDDHQPTPEFLELQQLVREFKENAPREVVDHIMELPLDQRGEQMFRWMREYFDVTEAD